VRGVDRRTAVRFLVVLSIVLATSIVFAVAHRTPAFGSTGETPAPVLFVSPTGSDGSRCTKTAPCASWNRAYQLAAPGTVVEIAAGQYPRQVIQWRASVRELRPGCTFAEPGRCIVLQPAAGATVVVNGGLEIRGSSVWVKGTATPSTGLPTRNRRYSIKVIGYVDTEADSEAAHPDHVLVEGVDATSFGVFNVDTATFRNIDVGPATIGTDCRIEEGNGFENKIGYAGGIEVVPRNVTLDGLLIHNQNRNPAGAASDCHFGGLFLVTANGLTVKNSVFSQNAVYNVQVQNFGGAPPPTNIRFENNVFSCPVGWMYDPGGDTQCDNQVDIQFNAESPFTNWLFRFNSFGAGIGQYVDGAGYSNVRVVGNVGSRPSKCFPGMTFAYNAWEAGSCSRTDRMLPRSPFVSDTPGSEDFQLVRGTRAAGFVPPEGADLDIRTDIEQQMRPRNFPRDAGAFQRDTAVMLLGRSIGSARIGMPRAALLERYGRPLRTKSEKLGEQKTRALVDRIAVPGGVLTATSVDDRVVGLSTRSAYYTTLRGLGPGSPAAELPRAGWTACKDVVRRTIKGTVVSFQLSRSKVKKRVVEAAMLRRAYDTPCPQAK
jgi:hypothetical protein